MVNIQSMPPISPPNRTGGVMISGFTTPLPIVLAIAVPRAKAATKFIRAANPTACIGDRTLVETTVAIALAASFRPLEKLNPKATIITARVTGSLRIPW